MSEVLDASEVAVMLRVQPDTVTAWARHDRIPAHKVGRELLFLRAEIIEWIADQPAKATCSISEVEPTGSTLPGRRADRLERLVAPPTGRKLRNITTSARQRSGVFDALESALEST